MKRPLLMLLIGTAISSGAAISMPAAAAPTVKHIHHHHSYRLPNNAIHVVIGGIKYWLSDGVYYRQKNKKYVVVKAPVGAQVKYLPNGAKVVKRNSKTFYVHKGSYYQWRPKFNRYEVVTYKPTTVIKAYKIGHIMKSLPVGAVSVRINGAQYFAYKGQHLKPVNRKGKAVFMVVNIA